MHTRGNKNYMPPVNSSAVRSSSSHNLMIGYLLWLFGFTGAHRFYYGKPITGTIWFFSFGLCGVGWLVDAFLLPHMNRQADLRFATGSCDYTAAWLLLTYLGVLGGHRFYMGKVGTGILYLLTGGIFLVGWVYDFWTLNEQVAAVNLGE